MAAACLPTWCWWGQEHDLLAPSSSEHLGVVCENLRSGAGGEGAGLWTSLAELEAPGEPQEWHWDTLAATGPCAG